MNGIAHNQIWPWLFQTKDKNSPFLYEPKKNMENEKNMLRSSHNV